MNRPGSGVRCHLNIPKLLSQGPRLGTGLETKPGAHVAGGMAGLGDSAHVRRSAWTGPRRYRDSGPSDGDCLALSE